MKSALRFKQLGSPGEMSGKIKVSYLGAVRDVVMKRDEEIKISSADTLRDLIAALSKKYGEKFISRIYNADNSLRHNVIILIDGKNIKQLNGLDTPLNGHSESQIVVTTIAGAG